MDKNMLVIVVVVIILIIGTKIMVSVAKQKKKNQIIIDNGTHFEAQIIGVAHPDRNLTLEGQPNRTVTLLGFDMADSTSAARHENMHRIRVKIKYIDPHTNQTITVHHVLNKTEYEDDRLIKVGNPGLLTLGSKSIAYMKHNKKLYETYVHDVKSRNLSKEEEKHLIREAILAMNNQNDEAVLDSEGYNVLTPPVIAEGYELNGEIHFIQRTNNPIFQDWTKKLK